MNNYPDKETEMYFTESKGIRRLFDPEECARKEKEIQEGIAEINKKYEIFDELKTRKEDLNKRSEASLNEAEARWFEKIAEAKKEAEEEIEEKIKNYKKEIEMKYRINKMWAVIGIGTTALAMSLVAYAIAATEK